MRQRLLHRTDDGSLYSDKVTLFYTDETSGHTLTFECNPDSLYALIHSKMQTLSQSEKEQQEAPGTSVESVQLRKRIAKLTKNMIRGGLKIFGNDLLTIFYGTKEHPKLPKTFDDPLDWYMDQFCIIGISYLLKQDIHLSGKGVESGDTSALYEIDSMATRPVSQATIQESHLIASDE